MLRSVLQNQRSPQVRALTFRALKRIGPAAKDVVPELIASVEDQECYEVSSAIEALGLSLPYSASTPPKGHQRSAFPLTTKTPTTVRARNPNCTIRRVVRTPSFRDHP